MYCPHCGNPLESGNRFCVVCGAPAPAANVNARPTNQVPQSANAQATRVMPKVGERTQPLSFRDDGIRDAGDGRKAPVLAIIITLAVLALITTLLATCVMPPAPEQPAAPSQATESSSQQDSESSESTQSETPSESESSSEAAPEIDPQAEAEQQARDAAIANGQQILEGQLVITTLADRAHEVEPSLHDFDNSFDTMFLLFLDQPTEISCLSAGDGYEASARTISTFRLGAGDTAALEGMNGQHIAVAIDIDPIPSTRYWYSDITGVLADATGSFTLISPPGQATSQAQPQPAAVDPNGDFVLVDSASRSYSKAELEAMDDHTLFLARNEIFARHGCGFKSQELRDWFASKSWYHETLAPGTYGTELLNDVERDNVNAMLEIEKSRNSPYL